MNSMHKLLQTLELANHNGLKYDIQYIYTRYDYNTGDPYIDEDDAFLTLDFRTESAHATVDFHINNDVIVCTSNDEGVDVWEMTEPEESIRRLKVFLFNSNHKKNMIIYTSEETKSIWQKMLNMFKNIKPR